MIFIHPAHMYRCCNWYWYSLTVIENNYWHCFVIVITVRHTVVVVVIGIVTLIAVISLLLL